GPRAPCLAPRAVCRPDHPRPGGRDRMSLTDLLTDYVHAAFSGLWVQTSEPDEAERELTRLAREQGWKLAAWDVAGGLRLAHPPGAPRPDAMPGDPLAVLRAVPALADPDGTALLLLHHY